jgi:cytosine/adenosine deaminase-related metal-dependent hydrolase
MLNAVTVNGAWALMRSDLGRLAPGAKADIVLVDLKHPLMQPARDPLRSLIYAAAERAVRDVYVNGTKVLEQGEVLTLDYARAVSRLEEVRQRTEENIPKADCKRRTSAEIAPLSLPKAK